MSAEQNFHPQFVQQASLLQFGSHLLTPVSVKVNRTLEECLAKMHERFSKYGADGAILAKQQEDLIRMMFRNVCANYDGAGQELKKYLAAASLSIEFEPLFAELGLDRQGGCSKLFLKSNDILFVCAPLPTRC